MIDAILNYNFMQNALIAAILASVACGIIGTIIIEKKLVMLSGGVAHTSFGGIGLGYLMGFEPIIGAFIFSIISSLSISHINRRAKTNSDALIGMFWSTGMALGILFIAFTEGYPPDMNSYLFGDILTVSNISINMMIIVDIIVIGSIFMFFNYWKAYLFDEEFAKVLGMPTRFLENFLFVLIALTIVTLLKVVGIILVLALLTIPPSIAKLFTYDFKKIIVTSIILGMIITISGLFISYQFNIASGATIILLGTIMYFIAFIIKKV